MRKPFLYIAPQRHPVVGRFSSDAYSHATTMSKWGYMSRAARRYAPKAKRYAAGAIASAVAQKLNSTRTMTRTMTDQDTSSFVTGQRDAKVDYRKRRLSKRQRYRAKRRYRSRRRIVNIVRNSNIGTTHIVRRSLCLLSSSAGVSNYVGFGLYSLNGQPQDTYNTSNDIGEMFKEMDSVSWAAVNDGAVGGQNHKVYTYHGTAEYTIRNNASAETGAAIVEAYYIYGRRPLNATLAPSPADAYTAGFNKQVTATDPNTGAAFDGPLAPTQIGVTPFQSALFTRNYKIYKRAKFLIPPGDEVSFVINDRRPRVFSMENTRTFSTDRNYIGVLFQQQGPPNAAGGAETPAQPTTLTYMCTRRYRIKMMRDNLTRDAFETSAS